MTRLVGVLALFGSIVWGQFSQFATTDEGSQIYFTTTLRERNAPDSPIEYRIFRLDGRALELFSERGDLANRNATSSEDGAHSLQVSGDGLSVAFTQTNICPAGDPCFTPIVRAEIRGRYARTFDNAERILLSRNGRWALVMPPRFTLAGPGQVGSESTEARLLNLETGVDNATGRPVTSDEYFALASDGSILMRRVGQEGRPEIGLWRDGELRPLPAIAGAVVFLGLSDDSTG